ncbi:MAG: alpha/beta hydrolase [Xanthobacteraceae bacterium]|nr:alpha/beta hydrolase [Xanthobacteraceae bacterium]
MRINVNGSEVFAATGGKDFDPEKPAVVFLHGAGFDHSTWALYTRWHAHNGFSVLAPDLPGHGLSGGKPLTSVGELADWVAALVEVTGAKQARLIGHSMGTLIAIETAARHPDKVTSLGLIAAATSMPVSDELLNAAKQNSPDAFAMMTIWGFGSRAVLGGCLSPGNWMMGKGVRVLEANTPGALFADLSATKAYDATGAAAKIKVPVTIVLAERDLMTPAKGGKALAALIPVAKLVILAGAGHMLVAERPDEVLKAIAA